MPEPIVTPEIEGGKETDQGTDGTPKAASGEDTPAIKNDIGQVTEPKTYTQEEANQMAKQARLDGEQRATKKIEEDAEVTQALENVTKVDEILKENENITNALSEDYVSRLRKADPTKVQAMFDNVKKGKVAAEASDPKDAGKEPEGKEEGGDPATEPLKSTPENPLQGDPNSKHIKVAEGIQKFQDSGHTNVDALVDGLEL